MLFQELFDLKSGHATGAGSGDGLAIAAVGDVSGGVHAGDAGVHEVLREKVAIFVGIELAKAGDSAAVMSRVRGHNMAKAALENALWDAEARQKQQPLWKLIFQRLRSKQLQLLIMP